MSVEDSDSGSENGDSLAADMMQGLSSEEMKEIIEQQKELKRSFSVFAKKREKDAVSDIAETFGLSRDEAKIALRTCGNDEMECRRQLVEEPEFLELIQNMLESNEEGEGDSGEMPESSTRSKRDETTPSSPKKVDPDMKTQVEVSKTVKEMDERMKKMETLKESIKSQIRNMREKRQERKAPSGFKMNGEKRAGSLRLTDALTRLMEKKRKEEKAKSTTKSKSKLEAEENSVEVDGIVYTRKDLEGLEWSNARIKAFMSIKKNPNTYYYRFNHPGEKQTTGGWSKEVHAKFMQKLEEGVNYRWGEFSKDIPGKVGYQCSNYYRSLIMKGLIKDPNYVMVDGKLKFLGPDGKRFVRQKEEKARKEALRRQREEEKKKKRLEEIAGKLSKKARGGESGGKKKKNKRRRKNGRDDVFAEEVGSDTDTDNEGLGIDTYSGGKYQELIPGLKCPLTLGKVYRPAISPFGHIMGYETWVKTLTRAPKNTCPFTSMPLTRRQLVKIDENNVIDYLNEIQKVLPTFDLSLISGLSQNSSA